MTVAAPAHDPAPVARSTSPPRSRAVQCALEFARAQFDKQAAAYTASQAAYAEGIGRVNLLRRAGRLLDASELLATLRPPPPPPPSSSRTLSPLRVRAVQRDASPNRPTRSDKRVPLLALDCWRSLVESASDPPPKAAAALTSPVHVITKGLIDLDPGARRARAQALVAAAKLVPFMTVDMIAKFLGYPSDELRRRDPSLVAADAVHAIGSGWSAGLIDGARTTWVRLQRFVSVARGRPTDARQQVRGHVVRDFLEAVDHAARRAYARRGNARAGDAQGSTARQGVVRNFKFLATNLSFPIDVSSKAVQLAMAQSRKRSIPKSAPPLGLRMLCVLSWLTQHGSSPFVRGHAAAWLAAAMFAVRFVNAQRSRLVSVVGDVVSAQCDLDAKAPGGSQVGRPMWTSRRDPLGSDAWITELVAMRDAHPRAEASDPRYFLRDTTSPRRRPVQGQRPMPGRAPGHSIPPGARLPLAVGATGRRPRSAHRPQSSSRPPQCLLRVRRPAYRHERDRQMEREPSPAGARVDGGHTPPFHASASTSTQPPSIRALAMPALYSSAAAATIVPAIMERQLHRLRVVVAQHDPATLPAVGGWSLMRSLENSPPLAVAPFAPLTSAGPSAPLLLTHRNDGEDAVAPT